MYSKPRLYQVSERLQYDLIPAPNFLPCARLPLQYFLVIHLTWFENMEPFLNAHPTKIIGPHFFAMNKSLNFPSPSIFMATTKYVCDPTQADSGRVADSIQLNLMLTKVILEAIPLLRGSLDSFKRGSSVPPN